MEEVIKLLRQQMVIYSKLSALLESLKAALHQREDSRKVSDAVKQIERMYAELSRLQRQQEKFLKTGQKENMASFVQAQPASVERDVAMRLLLQVDALQKKMIGQSASAKELLRHSKEFMEYHINLISRARAEGTYAPPEAGAAPGGSRRMFDANV